MAAIALAAIVSLGAAFPCAAQPAREAASAAPQAEAATVVVVPALPAVVYVGNIPILLSSQTMIVVRRAGVAVALVPCGPVFVNGVPVAVLRPTQVIVVEGPRAG